MDAIFKGIFDTQFTTVISVSRFLLCLGVSLVTGLLLALAHAYKSRSSKSFLAALAVLPAVVCVVIMMVNGNIGTGVAVAGTFSLVRFRSAPGTAREISGIFLAMCTGLIAGMGYLAFAVLFALILGGITLLYSRFAIRIGKRQDLHRMLHITVPEYLDYAGVFDQVLEQFAVSCQLLSVKTTNMGSLFRLTYELEIREPGKEKELIDELRCRNGNLEVALSRGETGSCEL